MNKFELSLLRYCINNEEVGKEIKETIKEITKLSDAEKESLINYIHFNWIEYLRSIRNETYIHIDLTTRVYNSWLDYRKNI